MYARVYAQILGVVLLLVGVLGLILGEGLVLGILNVDITEDIVHILTGGILAYVGFGQADEGLARNVVGALGVIYLLVPLRPVVDLPGVRGAAVQMREYASRMPREKPVRRLTSFSAGALLGLNLSRIPL